MTESGAWDVIVVGGGYCGVTAAVEIGRHDPGARVLLLEADAQLGGRARSVEIETHIPGQTQSFDLGAHYFGVHQRRVYDLAHRLLPPERIVSRIKMYGDNPAFRTLLDGAWKTTTKRETFFEIQGLDKRSSLHDRICLFKSLAFYFLAESLIDTRTPWRSLFASKLDSMTVADWIERQTIPAWIRQMWGLECVDIMSVYPRQISLLYWLWYNACSRGILAITNDMADGPQEYFVDIGLGGLLRLHAEDIRGTVRLGNPVVRIDHADPERIVVTTADGREETARRVIVAASPHAIGRHIEFSPDLHPARSLLHRQPAGHAAKAVFVYCNPWWRDSHGHNYMGMSAGPLAAGIEWMLDTSDPRGAQYSLTAFVNDRFFERFPAPVDETARKRALAAAMADAMGDERARDYVAIEVFQWRDAPFVGGGPNTSLRTGVLTQCAPVFNQPEGPWRRLYFASAEYSSEFTGYVEGAIAAGEHVAAQVVSDAANAGEASTPARRSVPALGGRRPRYWLSPLFLIAWGLLAAATRLAAPFSRRRPAEAT